MSVHEDPRPTYDPSAIVTPANVVTVLRILASPILLVMVVQSGPAWPTFLLGFTIGMSDLLDGWLARRQGSTTSGAFLDPLADKVLVLGTMFALVAWGSFHWLPVAIITAREVAMSVYRTRVARRGISVQASRLAKWKTFVQGWAGGFALLPPVAHDAHWIATATLWLAVALTVVTGWQYFRDARRIPELGRDQDGV